MDSHVRGTKEIEKDEKKRHTINPKLAPLLEFASKFFTGCAGVLAPLLVVSLSLWCSRSSSSFTTTFPLSLKPSLLLSLDEFAFTASRSRTNSSRSRACSRCAWYLTRSRRSASSFSRWRAAASWARSCSISGVVDDGVGDVRESDEDDEVGEVEEEGLSTRDLRRAFSCSSSATRLLAKSDMRVLDNKM